MSSANKDEYLVDLRLIIERVRESAKNVQQLGGDLEDFLAAFVGLTVRSD